MRVVFMGTPSFAVPSLEHLAAEHEVVLVLTRPRCRALARKAPGALAGQGGGSGARPARSGDQAHHARGARGARGGARRRVLRGGLRLHPARRGSHDGASGLRERPRLAPAALARRGAHPAVDPRGRRGDGRVDHAHRARGRYGGVLRPSLVRRRRQDGRRAHRPSCPSWAPRCCAASFPPSPTAPPYGPSRTRRASRTPPRSRSPRCASTPSIPPSPTCAECSRRAMPRPPAASRRGRPVRVLRARLAPGGGGCRSALRCPCGRRQAGTAGLRGRRPGARGAQARWQARHGRRRLGGRAARRPGHVGSAFVSALSPARVFALRCLIEARRDGSFAREVAEGAAYRPADARDAALGLRLVLGVTATSGVLDEFIDRFLTRPRDVAPAVRDALRIAAFEILCGGAPSRVAVSQGGRARAPRVSRAPPGSPTRCCVARHPRGRTFLPPPTSTSPPGPWSPLRAGRAFLSGSPACSSTPWGRGARRSCLPGSSIRRCPRRTPTRCAASMPRGSRQRTARATLPLAR